MSEQSNDANGTTPANPEVTVTVEPTNTVVATPDLSALNQQVADLSAQLEAARGAAEAAQRAAEAAAAGAVPAGGAAAPAVDPTTLSPGGKIAYGLRVNGERS